MCSIRLPRPFLSLRSCSHSPSTELSNLKASYASVLGFIHDHGIHATYFALQSDNAGGVKPAGLCLQLFVGKSYPFTAPRVRFMNNCHNMQLDDHLLHINQLFVWPRLASSYSATTR